MSAPCFARDAAARFGAGGGHEPLTKSGSLGGVAVVDPGIDPSKIYLNGQWYRWCVCRHCLALVLIAEIEIPR